MYSPQACSDSDSLTDVEETTPLVPTSVKGMNIQEISCSNLLGFGGLGGDNCNVCTTHITGPL